MRRVSFFGERDAAVKFRARAHATSFQRIHLGRLGHSLFPSQLNAALQSAPHTSILFPIKPPPSPSAIMSRNALNLLRSATSSLSPRAVTRSYYPIHRRAAIHSRTYSSTTPENDNGTSKGPGSAEKKTVDTQETVPPLSELEAKLKTKEEEVLDMRVRVSQQLMQLPPSDLPYYFRAGCDISRRTF
jgi:hypothetical protein